MQIVVLNWIELKKDLNSFLFYISMSFECVVSVYNWNCLSGLPVKDLATHYSVFLG